MSKDDFLVNAKEGLYSCPSPDLVTKHWRRVVRRRFFLHGIGATGVALTAGRLFGASSERLTEGDAALLRFAAAAEIVESDLWQQYNELGGAVKADDSPNSGNSDYVLALQNIDGDMPQYISDNTDDELSHAAFINAYLMMKGEEPVDFTQFATFEGSTATGASGAPRLTNLMSLNVDTSWYFRYRSTQNPDQGATFPQLLNISKQPAIPLAPKDPMPGSAIAIPPGTSGPSRVQAMANTASIHFAFIEQGGSSLYPILALKATSLEVLRILLSIGGVEIDHFSLWHDKCGNAISMPLAGTSDPITGLSFPDFNNAANQHNAQLSKADTAAGSQMFQTNLILPEPCEFLVPNVPCSIIRPTLSQNGGPIAAVNGFVADGLFTDPVTGKLNAKFVEKFTDLAEAANAAKRES